MSLSHMPWFSLPTESVSRAMYDLFPRSDHQRPHAIELVEALSAEGVHLGAQPLFFGYMVVLQYIHKITSKEGKSFTKYGLQSLQLLIR